MVDVAMQISACPARIFANIDVDLNFWLSARRLANLPPTLPAVIVFMGCHFGPDFLKSRCYPTHAMITIVFVGVQIVLQQEALTRTLPHIEPQEIVGFIEGYRPIALFVVTRLEPRLLESSQTAIGRCTSAY